MLGSSLGRELAGALLEPSWPACHMRSHHLHPSHLAGDASIIELFKRVARGRARDRDDMPTLPRDQRPINELERSLRHIKVRFLFRVREHIPACSDMRAPSVHHMLHAEHPHARAHARTASRSIAFSARDQSSLLPLHLAGHYSARFGAQTIIPAAFDTFGSGCARWCFLFFPGRAQCSPFLSRRVLGAVA